jgi:hypothetical protein
MFPFRAQCLCDRGYVGDGVAFCDECGLGVHSVPRPSSSESTEHYKKESQSSTKQPKTKAEKERKQKEEEARRAVQIAQTIARHRWPASVLIIFNYQAIVEHEPGQFVTRPIFSRCGGVLIDRQTVLTPAHCILDEAMVEVNGKNFRVNITTNKFYPTRASMFTIYVGMHSRDELKHAKLKAYSPAKITVHPEFDWRKIQNDLALIKLNTPIDLDARIQVACLPPSNKMPSYQDKESWLVGWGSLGKGDYDAVPDLLQDTDLQVFDGMSKCSLILEEMPKNASAQICAGLVLQQMFLSQTYLIVCLKKGEWDAKPETCVGDSGGALYVRAKGAKYFTVGMASYGGGCSKPYRPG